jgi:DNA-binding MarR family transcriptional regulator
MGAHTSLRARTGGDSASRAILDSIRRIVQALRISSRHAERVHRLSGAQLFVLQILAEAQSLSLNELAACTLTHQSSVSVVVQRLVRAKLITRRISADDHRCLELALTARGRQLSSRGPDVAQHRIVSAINKIDARSRETLAQLLQLVVRHAGFAGGSPALFFEDSAPKKSSKRRARKAIKRG